MSFFEELKRRNVFRVAIAYVVTAWLLLQIVDLVLENINAPDWVMQVFMLALAIGFPLAVFFAWAFEMTPEGVRRESEVDRSKSITPQTGRKMDRIIIIVMALALAYFAYDKFFASAPDSLPQSTPAITSEKGPEEKESGSFSQQASITEKMASDEKSDLAPLPVETTNPGEKSVAVLPFVNMSDDKDNEYFSDGISEELLNVLVRIKGLRVPSRTSSFSFKDSSKKLIDIGKELQVDHILEGSVRKAGNRIRVTAQLIEVITDTHLWSETYTRELDDIFAVQDEIAQAIVDALKVTLTVSDQAQIHSRSTASVEAYNKYLLGRHLWNQRSPSSLLASVEPLNAAIALDPQFGRAWEALADAYVLIPEYRAGNMHDYIPLAHDAISKALAINPQSARALTTSAYIKFMYDYDFEGATAEFKQAIKIDPGYATAHQWYGELLAAERKLDAALEQLRLARLADPLAHIMPHDMAWFLMWTDRRDEAYQYFEESRELNPSFQNGYMNLGLLYLMDGNFDLARENIRKALSTNHVYSHIYLPFIDAMENPALRAKTVELVLADSKFENGVNGKARMLMFLGEPELAMDHLEMAMEIGDPYAVHLNRVTVFDPLRDNPRFQALLKKMNLLPE